MISEEMLLTLREKVKPYMTEKRYVHILGVEREAEALGRIFLPDKVPALRAAALLHDITKRDSMEKQLQYCREFGVQLDECSMQSPKTLHAITASVLAARDFAAYVTPEICDGIRWHTTGKADMTMFEAILFLADYIEDTRTFTDCVVLRRYFWEHIKNAGTMEEKTTVLDRTMVQSFDKTIAALREEGAYIHKDTIAARDTYVQRLQRKNIPVYEE